ncbi:MAG TPA: acyclic terpene utilization AtuA family protein [Bacteroidota bacterium]|nr:acyclic terpene utilization AtuA family protein [Bacteroidota bacterium]
MKSKIRIASGQGFWGDLQTAPIDQVRKGPIDYLVMDYLAEVTMSILQKQKARNPMLGYALDCVPLLTELMSDIVEKNIVVITNAGGVNPIACREALYVAARSKGYPELRIGVVTGDDILPDIDALVCGGAALSNMDTGKELSTVRERLMSANVYFGAVPIVEALARGAQIVITGRTTDTGLTLAPMMHEFGWNTIELDKLAAGTVAGHILECGAQSTGGNFSADWRSVPDLAHVGFPIAEAMADGNVVITKHESLGGLVTEATVKEQLLYEIGNPKNYITPECTADFTSIRLEQEAMNRVRVYGVRGTSPTEMYKVSMSYRDGYTAFATLTYAWPEAVEKARAADGILRERLRDAHCEFDEIRTEYLGHDSCFGPNAVSSAELNEVVMRVGVRGRDIASIERFSREIAPLILTGPPSVTGFAGGRPKPSEVIAYWPALIEKTLVHPAVDVGTPGVYYVTI